MRKVLLMALVCAMLTSWSAVGHPLARKASAKSAAKERVVFAAGEKAESQEAKPADDEKANDSKADDEKKEPTPAAEKTEPPVPAVKESEGTGPVAAFWFVLPER